MNCIQPQFRFVEFGELGCEVGIQGVRLLAHETGDEGG